MNDDEQVAAFMIAIWGIVVLVGLAFWAFIGWLVYLLVMWVTTK